MAERSLCEVQVGGGAVKASTFGDGQKVFQTQKIGAHASSLDMIENGSLNDRHRHTDVCDYFRGTSRHDLTVVKARGAIAGILASSRS